jgi:hypothetical protein
MISNIAGDTETESISQELDSPDELEDVEDTPEARVIKIDEIITGAILR